MKQSIGYTVSLNIVIVFIVIVFAFIGGSISYYKAYKVNNVIEDSIEKYEGFNELSKKDIEMKLSSLGYDRSFVNCGKRNVKADSSDNKQLIDKVSGSGEGYCVYYNVLECASYQKETIKTGASVLTEGSSTQYCKAKYYNYIIKTYLRFQIPIVNRVLKIPVYTKTNSMYACYGGQC